MKKENLIQAGVIIIIFILLFKHTIFKLVKDWSIDANFSHGFLIPFVAIYMVWFKKDKLKNIEIKPSNLGLIIILLGMAAHIAGNLGAELFVMRFSMLITISGIIIFFLGKKMFMELLVPIAYLILMIPIPAILWNKIAFPLQLFAASMAEKAINLTGIPIFREGNILHLAETSLEVVDACSGLRSLTTLIALSGAFAFVSPLKKSGKIILFFSAIPIAVAVNIFRLTITAMAAEYIGPETAQGFLHEMSGLIVFTSAIFLIFITFILIDKIEKKFSSRLKS